MGYLSNKSVYLAGPMHAVADDGTGWRDWITPILQDRFGLVVEDPAKKSANGVCEVKDDKANFKKLIAEGQFAEVKKQFKPIVRKDLRAVDKADLLIVVYDPTVHMFGTIHEVVTAHHQQKPIYIYCDPAHQAQINPWLFTLIKPEWLFLEWEPMLERLVAVDNGDINPDYWSL
jgi:nucleoside 2-deoxyribosyltransferase